MAHTSNSNNTLLYINKAKKQHKQQAKQQAATEDQLNQCKKRVQKSEQKLLQAQMQLAVSKTHLSELTTKIEELHRQQRYPDNAPLAAPTNQQEVFPVDIENQAPLPTMAGDVPLTQEEIHPSLPESASPDDNTQLPQSGLYAYALISKPPDQLDLMGIDQQHRVFPVTGNGLSVMVSEINVNQFQSQVKHLFSELATSTGEAQGGTVSILQAHENVIDALMQDTTVIPLKFGTILKDTQAAIKMLQEQEEHFKELLTKLNNKVEWGIKVYADKQALISSITREDPHFANSQPQNEKVSRGRSYLLERKKTEELNNYADAQLSQASEKIFQALEAGASDAHLNTTLSRKTTGKKKEMILNAVFLIEKAQVTRFKRQKRKFTDIYSSMDLDYEFSGPWPPYNFT